MLTVLVDPVNAGTVYVGTDKQGVWKTTDCGSTWVKTNTGSGGAALDTGLLWSMGINPVHPDFIYAGSLYSSDNSLLRSTDSGVTWTSLFPAGSEIATHVEYNFLQELSIDPVDPNHIVVTFHADCRAPYAKMCMAESLDRGDTWRMFNGPADAWVENSRPLALNLTSFLYVTGQDGVWHTGDSGRTWDKTSMPGGGHQLYIRDDGEYFLGSYAGVWQSSNGKDWSKIEGSPAIDGLTGDGERIFGAMSNDGGRQPFYSAPVDAGAPWTKLASPPIGGSPRLEYEKDHHVLYAATKADGLWRMVTQ